MKDGRPHRVLSSSYGLRILKALGPGEPQEYILPGRKAGAHLSNMSFEMHMRRMGVVDYTVHGTRSAFRDWAGEETEHAREVAEAVLAHSVGDAAEQAYRRGDALAKRRRLMDEWAGYLAGT